MDAAEEADGRRLGIGVAQGDGAQRQALSAAGDLAQVPRVKAGTAGSDDLLQVVEFVNTGVRHLGFLPWLKPNACRREDNAGAHGLSGACLLPGEVCTICHPAENLLQHKTAMVRALPQPNRERAMKALIDRFFSDIDRFFDDQWVVIWMLDDF